MGTCGDLQGRTDATNDECCDEPSEDCTSGRPATCNENCARVLLPFFTDCSAELGSAASDFDDVVALCHDALAANPAGAGSAIAVSYTIGDPPHLHDQIFIVDEDGLNPRQVTSVQNGAVQPSWSPDGRQITFAEQTPQGMQLRIVRMDGSGAPRPLTHPPQGYSDILPSWINATHVVFGRQSNAGSVHIARCLATGERDATGSSSLFVVDTRPVAAGKVPKAHTLFRPGARPPFVSDSMPSVSPDGKRVAFVTNHTSGAAAGDARVWVADVPTGANAHPISPGAETVDLQGDGCFTPISQKVPAWSPDGTQVAHWEGIEMNYLAAFSCQPGHDPKLCRHDPQRDGLITNGNIAEGGNYVGWKVWTVQMSGQEWTDTAAKVNQGQGDDPVWSPDNRLARAYPSPQEGWTTPGPLIMLQQTPHGTTWAKLPILPPNTRGWGRFGWKPRTSIFGSQSAGAAASSPITGEGASEVGCGEGPGCQDKR